MSVLDSFIYCHIMPFLELNLYVYDNNSVFYLGFSDANKFNLGKKLYCSLTGHFCMEIH